MPAGSSIAVVTDSTATLPPEVAAERGIFVVPLQVVIGAHAYDEGTEGATPAPVAAALSEFLPVSTSRPAPALLLELTSGRRSRGPSRSCPCTSPGT